MNEKILNAKCKHAKIHFNVFTMSSDLFVLAFFVSGSHNHDGQ